tara:strand:+ start:406 stop:1302 length:897 start_codon:yes stop_codon:yes gene_type:complete
MTISIGLIPNDKTVMLLQDSEISYQSLGFTQDLFNKIKQIDDTSLAGIIGDSRTANLIIDYLKNIKPTPSKELRDSLEEAYHKVMEEKLSKGVLKKYGFKDIREVSQPHKETMVDQDVRSQVLNAADGKGIDLDVMLISNIDEPQIYTVGFPGVGRLENNIKMYDVSGSGSILAINKLGEELEKYRWKSELSINEGIDVLMHAGKEAEKHTGVGGPFDIKYITKDDKGKNKIVTLDQKKINMVMYLLPFNIDKDIMNKSIDYMLRDNDKKSPEDISKFIKENTGVGIEFDHYFGLNKK